MIRQWVGMALMVGLVPLQAGANEGCWTVLNDYFSGPSAQTPEARQKALQKCGEDSNHQQDVLLQKMLKRCARQTVGHARKDIEECELESYRWNQRFEYPGPVKTGP